VAVIARRRLSILVTRGDPVWLSSAHVVSQW
jgi:hypothetical protein